MPDIQKHKNAQNISKLKRITLVSFFILLFFNCFSQEKEKLEIVRAGSLKKAEKIPDAKQLVEDVVLKQKSKNILIYCDSALFYETKNRADLFGHVHINRADTIHLYAQKAYYDGNSNFAQAIKNVRLQKRETTLYTDTLDYDLNMNVGYYNCSGKIVDSTNILTSKIGKYFVDQNTANFIDSVVGYNDKYIINSENLKYNTLTKIISFSDSTTIRDSANTLYAEKGWYNTQTGEADLKSNPKVYNETQILIADHIKYNKANGNGQAIGNAHIEDFSNKAIVKGNKVLYNKPMDIITATDSAVFISYNDIDSLFLHADTLQSIPDTIEGEKIIKAFYGVRFFRTDLQGVCDSLTYHTTDSLIELSHNPVIWNTQHQIFADYIKMIQHSDAPDEMHIMKNSFIISQEDSGRFNQIKGKNMYGYIIDNKLDHVDVDGNGQTLYYAYDKGAILGLNHAESSKIAIRLSEGKVNTIVFKTQPTAKLIPVEKLQENEKTLAGFDWKAWLRPMSKNDIYQTPKRTDSQYKKAKREHVIE